MSRSQINGKMKECIILFNNKLLSAAKLWLSEKVFTHRKYIFIVFQKCIKTPAWNDRFKSSWNLDTLLVLPCSEETFPVKCSKQKIIIMLPLGVVKL